MTIRIQKGEANDLVVTVTELQNSALANFWLFRFLNDQNQDEYLVFLDDISTDTERYNKLVLIEGTDVSFSIKGDYKYEIYQMPDNADTDYTRGELNESGKIIVWDDNPERTEYTPDQQKTIYEQ